MHQDSRCENARDINFIPDIRRYDIFLMKLIEDLSARDLSYRWRKRTKQNKKKKKRNDNKKNFLSFSSNYHEQKISVLPDKNLKDLDWSMKNVWGSTRWSLKVLNFERSAATLNDAKQFLKLLECIRPFTDNLISLMIKLTGKTFYISFLWSDISWLNKRIVRERVNCTKNRFSNLPLHRETHGYTIPWKLFNAEV